MTQRKELEEALGRVKEVPSFTPTSVGPWSISKLKTLEKCPLHFFLSYLVKLKVVRPEDPDDVLRRNAGTTLHRILELMFSGETFEAAVQQAKEEYFEIVTPERWEFVEKHYPQVRRFERRMGAFEEDHPIATVSPELKLAITKDFQKTDFSSPDAYFRGVIDLPLDLENGDSIILDHKRGGSPSYGLRYHQAQLSTYHLLKYFGDKPFKGVQAGIHFIEAGQVVMGKYTKAEQVVNLLPEWLNNKIETAVQTVVEAGSFLPNKGTACTYCDYKDLCRNGKRGTVGDLQAIQVATKKLF